MTDMKKEDCRFEKIKVDLLHSQLEYQRKLDYEKVKDIASNWDWGMFDMPCVNFRDGMYSVIEGQHTVAGAKMKFGTNIELLCKVKLNLTKVEESEWFYKESIKKGQQTAETKYRARLIAEDKELLKLIDDLQVAGLILKVNTPSGKCVVDAIKTIEEIHNQMNDIDFISCFKLLKETWHGDSESLRMSFLRGMVKFYETFSLDFNEKRFITALSKIKPVDIKYDVNKDNSDNKEYIKYARSMCKFYNKNIKGNKLKISKLED